MEYPARDPEHGPYTAVWRPGPDDPIIPCPNCTGDRLLVPIYANDQKRVLCWACMNCRYAVTDVQSAVRKQVVDILELFREEQRKGDHKSSGGSKSRRKRSKRPGARHDDPDPRLETTIETTVVERKVGILLKLSANEKRALERKACERGQSQTALIKGAIAREFDC